MNKAVWSKVHGSTGGWPDNAHPRGKHDRGNGLNCLQLFWKERVNMNSGHFNLFSFFGLFCLQNYSIVKSNVRVGSLRDKPVMR